MPEQENNPFQHLANKLDELQKSKNDGRGVSCVRTIITYLKMGDIEKAKAVCLNESDKIRSYSDIKELLKEDLVKWCQL